MPPSRTPSTEPKKPLKPIVLLGISALLPVSLAAFVVGLVGVMILLDEEGTSSYSQTEFARQYKRLIAWNPFFSAVFFNGGMIGLLFTIIKLAEHFGAVKAAKAAGVTAAVAIAETKKEQ